MLMIYSSVDEIINRIEDLYIAQSINGYIADRKDTVEWLR